jgi:hypothetical protein
MRPSKQRSTTAPRLRLRNDTHGSTISLALGVIGTNRGHADASAIQGSHIVAFYSAWKLHQEGPKLRKLRLHSRSAVRGLASMQVKDLLDIRDLFRRHHARMWLCTAFPRVTGMRIMGGDASIHCVSIFGVDAHQPGLRRL